jgi:hypothetical protein
MGQFASDNFNGVAGTLITTYDANWTRLGAVAANIVISDAGRARQNNGIPRYYKADATPPSADYSVSGIVTCKSFGVSSSSASVLGRVNGAADDSYRALVVRLTSGGSCDLRLGKTIAGAFTQLGSSVNKTLALDTPYTLKLDMQGSTIRLLWQGVEEISVTDTELTAAGFPGMAFQGTSSDTTGFHLDDWSAETASGTFARMVGPRFALAGLGGLAG